MFRCDPIKTRGLVIEELAPSLNMVAPLGILQTERFGANKRIDDIHVFVVNYFSRHVQSGQEHSYQEPYGGAGFAFREGDSGSIPEVNNVFLSARGLRPSGLAAAYHSKSWTTAPAHELGHILADQGHDEGPRESLMIGAESVRFDVTKGTEDALGPLRLRVEQQERMRQHRCVR